MIKAIKSLTKKQIIIIVSVLIVLTGIITTTIILLTKDKEEIKKCLVEFDTNGGSIINSQEITCGNTIKEPDTKPEKTGFEFINWTYNNEEFNFNTKINENIVLIANYNKTTDEEIVIVTFNSDGGNEVKPIELIKGTTITEPVNPIKQNYNFEGWYLNENKFDFSQVINESITLIAKWSEKKNNQGNNNKPNGGTNTNQGGNSNSNQGQTGGNQGSQGGNQGTTTTEPKPEENLTFIGNARLVNFCPNNYKEYKDDYCYKTTKQEKYSHCEGIEKDGICYKAYHRREKSNCNGEDKYNEATGLCYPKIYETRDAYSDGTCPTWKDSHYELNSEGKCEGWYITNENKYWPTKTYYCPNGTIQLDENYCGEVSTFVSKYRDCPSGSIEYGRECYYLDTKTNPLQEYRCGYIGDKPEILIGDKCYFKQ